MSLTAGALSKVSATSTTASLLSAAATSGTTPYSYQWYRSLTSGFSPGAGSSISGATALSLSQTGLIPGTQYYYKVVIIDSAATPASVSATQLGVLTSQPVLSQNSFSQGPFLGLVDAQYSYNTKAVQVDSTQGSTPVSAGQAIKYVASAGGVPKVIACSANSDVCMGFVNYNIKDQSYASYSPCAISQKGNVIYLYSTGAIDRGAQVTLDVSTVGGVAQYVQSSGATIVGFAQDQASAAGQLIRVELTAPSFSVA